MAGASLLLHRTPCCGTPVTQVDRQRGVPSVVRRVLAVNVRLDVEVEGYTPPPPPARALPPTFLKKLRKGPYSRSLFDKTEKS